MISRSHVLFLGEQWYCVSLKSNCCCCCSVAKSCPAVCDLMDSSPAGSSLHGVLQARVLEWAAIPSPGDLPDPGITLRPPACGQILYLLSHRCCCCCCCVAPVVSASVRPHRRQPSRLPHPWDSPGRNTGVGCHSLLQCMKVKSESEVAQSCPTLCDPIDGSPPGSPVPGTLQARTLEWVAISFSNAWKWKVKVKSLSRVWLLATPWSAAHQAPRSMGLLKFSLPP